MARAALEPTLAVARAAAGAGAPHAGRAARSHPGQRRQQRPHGASREVLFFEAADKYVRVVTADVEHLIRTSLKELLPQLDPQRFWQVHRGTVVRARRS